MTPYWTKVQYTTFQLFARNISAKFRRGLSSQNEPRHEVVLMDGFSSGHSCMISNPEKSRLVENHAGESNWHRWGPYLSERAWGTVREDYSANGDAWNYFPHDHARSRAYRWNEDGMGGFCDDKQHLCLAVALWNEKDPILKERMFGLTQSTRESRRGCQGILLFPRQHADAFVHEDAL